MSASGQVAVRLQTGRRPTELSTFTGTVTQVAADSVLVTFERPFPAVFVEGRIERLSFTWVSLDKVEPR
jgi:hypothetical protein